MSEENLERQRARLARNRAARDVVTGWGLSSTSVKRFALGLKAPYRSRTDGQAVEDALSFPVFGADGARLARYGFLNLDGVTINPPHPIGWGVGTPLSYWSSVASPALPLVVAPDVRTLWLLEQLLDADDRALRMVVLTASHGSDIPVEWGSPRFWSDWPRVVVLDDATRGPSRADAVARVAGREVRRLERPEGHPSWSETIRAGMSARDFRDRLAAAPVWDVPIEREAVDPGELGDFGFEPVHVASAFVDGNVYYPYLVEERTAEAEARRPGARATLVQGYAVRVLRSDGRVLRVETLPAPRGATEDEKVVALSDGTRISAEPAVSRFASWSFRSIQRFVRLRRDAVDRLHRVPGLIAADVEAYLRDCVWLLRPDDFAVAAAYVMATYVYQVFDAVPLMLVTGPKGSGKSEMAQALADLSCNGVVVGQASAAGLVRLMHETRGLLVVDDLERIGAGVGGAFGEIHQMLKVGYKRSTGRKPVVDRSGTVVTLDFFGPKAITNTGGVEPILGSRCIKVAMAPIPDAVAGGLEMLGPDGARAQELRDELHCWGMARAADVHAEYRRIARRRGRREEIEAPLRAVAAMVGGAFERRLADALAAGAPAAPVPDPAERVRLAVRSCGVSAQVTIQQIQLELALGGGGGDELSPEAIGRALMAAGLRAPEAVAMRVRLHGVLCRVVELRGPAADAADGDGDGDGNGDGDDRRALSAGPLDFCRAAACSTCRYAAVCRATLPQLHAGKARAHDRVRA